MRILKRILLGLLIFVVLFTASLFGSWQFYFKPKYAKTILEFVNSIEIDEIIDSGIVAQSQGITTPAENPPNSISQNAGASTNNKNTNNKNTNDKNTNDKNANNKNTNSQSTNQTQKPKSKQEEILAQVESQDRITGLSIAKKLDMGYLSELAKGGITPEERKEISKYLRSKLTSAEINELKRLINKYSYLLE
ncbi:MAG: hypothetical protein GX196_00615 [Clostridiaceae bacterium]|nr:hypothetical protein [Clostridiaceae bacterium]